MSDDDDDDDDDVRMMSQSDISTKKNDGPASIRGLRPKPVPAKSFRPSRRRGLKAKTLEGTSYALFLSLSHSLR